MIRKLENYSREPIGVPERENKIMENEMEKIIK